MVDDVAGLQRQLASLESEMRSMRGVLDVPALEVAPGVGDGEEDGRSGCKELSLCVPEGHLYLNLRGHSPLLNLWGLCLITASHSFIFNFSLKKIIDHQSGSPPIVSIASGDGTNSDDIMTSRNTTGIEILSPTPTTPIETISPSSAKSTPKRRSPNPSSPSHDTELFRRLTGNWKITIRPDGIRIHTDIRNFQDLVDLTLVNTEHMRPDDPENPLSPTYLLRHRGRRPTMHVTVMNFALGDSSVTIFKRAMARRATEPVSQVWILQPAIEMEMVQHLYDAYFACQNLLYPLFHRPTFTRLYYDARDPTSSAVICAMCATLTLSQCEHTTPLFRRHGLSTEEQRRVAHHFAAKARDLLGEVFDEPSFGTMMVMGLLLQFVLVSLDVSKVFLYTATSLSVAETLKQSYTCHPDTTGGEDARATREMFKRGYHFLCVTAAKFRFLQEYDTPYVIAPPRIDLRVLGPPEPLPGEDGPLARCVQWYRHLLELGDYQLADDYVDMHYLYSKLSDRLPLEACVQVETSLFKWWADLPPSFRLTPNIFEYVSPEEMARADFYTLNLTLCFYACWLTVHAHFLPQVQQTGLSAAKSSPLSAMGAESAKLALRSLTVCVRSANIVTAVAEHAHERWPCKFDAHMLLHACDVHHRLSMMDDVRLAAMGRRNLMKSLKIVRESILGGGLVNDGRDHVARYYTCLAEALGGTLKKIGIEFWET